jgi:hypothetical protein
LQCETGYTQTEYAVTTWGYITLSIVARFFPNGEFSLGVDSSKRRDKRTHPLEGYEKRRHDDGTVYLQWERRDIEVSSSLRYSFIGKEYKSALHGWIYLCVDMSEKLYPTFYYQDDSGKGHEFTASVPIGVLIKSGELIDLGSSDARILEKKPESRKKLLTMTKNMARNIRNGVYLLEQKHGKDVLSFLTLTVPSLPNSSMEAIRQQWGRLTNEILKWLAYKCQKQNIPFEYVYCTEIQEKRFESRGEYVPHLHIVFRGKYDLRSSWAVSPKCVRKAWLRILSTCVGHSVKSNAVENLQVIRRSAARYLSKYVSKGVRSSTERYQGLAGTKLHTQWGGMSRTLSQEIKKGIKCFGKSRGTEDIAILLSRNLPHLVGGQACKYYKESYIPLGQYADSGATRYLKVAVGCLTDGLLQGGLVRLLEAVYKREHDTRIKELLSSLDSFWFN